MKKLQIIKNFLLIAEFLMVAGLAIVVYIIGGIENHVFSSIGQPNLEITDREVSKSMFSLIPQPDSEEPIILEAKYVDFSLQATPQLKAIIIGMAVLVVAYVVIILEIFQRIVRDVKEQKPFNMKNIRRVKIIGILITAAPIFEYGLRKGFMAWIESKFTFNQMELVSEADHGWSVFIIGLLIVVLGVAFEQAQKMQEENELTV